MINKIINIIRNVSASDASLTMLAKIYHQGVLTMATVAELHTALDTLNATIVAEQAKVLAAVTALQTQLNNGTAITAADLDTILAQINSANTAVQGIFTPAV